MIQHYKITNKETGNIDEGHFSYQTDLELIEQQNNLIEENTNSLIEWIEKEEVEYKNTFISRALWKPYSPLTNGGFHIKLYVEKQQIHQRMLMDDFMNKEGVVTFSLVDKVDEDFLEDLDGLELEGIDKRKSPSERLRGVLFFLCKAETNNWDELTKDERKRIVKSYYDMEIERQISEYSSRIRKIEMDQY